MNHFNPQYPSLNLPHTAKHIATRDPTTQIPSLMAEREQTGDITNINPTTQISPLHTITHPNTITSNRYDILGDELSHERNLYSD